MISRSDGKNFHLLLADRPLPYPAERGDVPAQRLSLCFWYSSGNELDSTRSTLVLVPGYLRESTKIFRQIEFIADLLAAELVSRQKLANFYELQNHRLRKLSY